MWYLPFVSVFVMTAADPRESSFACYYDKLRGTYLGDVFSVKWMEDSDVVSFVLAGFAEVGKNYSCWPE